LVSDTFKEFAEVPETLYDCFEHQVQRHPNEPFLGTRKRIEGSDGEFGQYEWETYAQVN